VSPREKRSSFLDRATSGRARHRRPSTLYLTRARRRPWRRGHDVQVRRLLWTTRSAGGEGEGDFRVEGDGDSLRCSLRWSGSRRGRAFRLSRRSQVGRSLPPFCQRAQGSPSADSRLRPQPQGPSTASGGGEGAAIASDLPASWPESRQRIPAQDLTGKQFSLFRSSPRVPWPRSPVRRRAG